MYIYILYIYIHTYMYIYILYIYVYIHIYIYIITSITYIYILLVFLQQVFLPIFILNRFVQSKRDVYSMFYDTTIYVHFIVFQNQ